MNYNLVFTIYGLIFTILLLLTLFFKKRKSTIRTKTYIVLIVFSIIYSVSEVISLYGLILLPTSWMGVLFKNINNVCMFNIITIFIVYFNINYYNLNEKYDSLLKALFKEKHILILCILDAIFSIVYMIVSRDKVIDVSKINFISTSVYMLSVIEINTIGKQ